MFRIGDVSFLKSLINYQLLEVVAIEFTILCHSRIRLFRFHIQRQLDTLSYNRSFRFLVLLDLKYLVEGSHKLVINLAQIQVDVVLDYFF